jgi:hypothetical protein
VKNKRGFALITVILIILALSIVVSGIVSFASSGIYLNTARGATGTALAAAQAGVYAAIIDYKADSRWNGAVNVPVIAGVSSYSCGKAANYLLLNASRPQFATSGITNNRIQRIGHSNINSASSITINQVKVEWSGFAGNLTAIYLGGASRWTGTAASGTTVTLTSAFVLAAGAAYTVATQNYFQFSTTIPISAVITVTYYFSDGSTRRAVIYNAGRGGNNEFSIISTGRRTIGNDISKASIEATYDVGVGHITSWKVSQSQI